MNRSNRAIRCLALFLTITLIILPAPEKNRSAEAADGPIPIDESIQETLEIQGVSGNETQMAMTDEYGDCTFLNVPFGAYALTANKSGYREGRSFDEFLYSGNLSDGARFI